MTLLFSYKIKQQKKFCPATLYTITKKLTLNWSVTNLPQDRANNENSKTIASAMLYVTVTDQ